MLLLEVSHVVSNHALIFIVKPHSTTWIPSLLVPRLLLNLRNDALGSFHELYSLLRFLEKALVEKKSFS